MYSVMHNVDNANVKCKISMSPVSTLLMKYVAIVNKTGLLMGWLN